MLVQDIILSWSISIARTAADSLESKQDEMAEQRGYQPREQQDETVVRRRTPDPGVPKHLKKRIVAVHGRLIGEPNQSPC